MSDFYTCGVCGREVDRHSNHEVYCPGSDRNVALLRQVAALPSDVRREIRRRANEALLEAFRTN